MNDTILVIEDNFDMLENTAEILALADYNVIKAKNGREGLMAILKNHPDLILCDVMMPELDGYGVLHEIENSVEILGTPFVFVTALSEKNHVREGMTLGADDYITKPFTSEELLKVVSFRLKKAKSLKGLVKKSQQSSDLALDVNYAKKVYNAFLTKGEEIHSIFPDSFLMYKPQEIISGDFYRFHKFGDKTIIVFGDSTGHGVSASYISITILNILSRILRDGLIIPGKILQTMHDEMRHCTFSDKNAAMIESADTIACSFDHKNRMLHYASANMRGLIIRNGEFIELKMNNCSVGDHSMKTLMVTDNFVQLEREDRLYLFSDGFENQFGDIENKRFNYKQLTKVLKENYLLSMDNQNQLMNTILTSWQGRCDQTDDITLLGLKIE